MKSQITHECKKVNPMKKVFNIKFSSIKLEKLINRSGLGEVWEGFCGDVKSAIRIADWDSSSSTTNHDDLQSEVSELCKISSPNITLFLGACQHNNKVYICSEYSSQNLSTYLSTTRMTLTHRLELAHGAALGMRWLHSTKLGPHSTGTVHRHVKTSSFLIFEAEEVKVCDFGLSSYWTAPAATSKDLYNQLWTAPEVRAERSGFTLASDVYSFGLVLLHVLTLRDPGTGAVEIPGTTPPPLRALIEACTGEDPAKRPKFDEITRRLKDIIFELTFPDPEVREWWNTSFDGESEVSWDAFVSKYNMINRAIGTPDNNQNNNNNNNNNNNDDDVCADDVKGSEEEEKEEEEEEAKKKGLEYLNELICVSGNVKMSKFGDVVDRLCGGRGEWRKVGTIALEYFRKPWFHGYLSENLSVGFLGNCSHPGAFLIRFSSSTRRAFVVSYKDGASDIKHAKIMRVDGRFEYDGRLYGSLDEVVERNNKLFKHPIPYIATNLSRNENDKILNY